MKSYTNKIATCKFNEHSRKERNINKNTALRLFENDILILLTQQQDETKR